MGGGETVEMTAIESQIVEAWNINNRVNQFLIDNIPQKAFAATLSTRGGRDIARQLAHMHMVRARRLEAFARKSKISFIHFDPTESPDRENLSQAFEQSGKLMAEYMTQCIDRDGVVPNFKRGLAAMLGYYISHEAHHRGHILLTMKQCGIKIPEPLRFGLWEWNKI